ncbi:hypothetical protein ACTWQJ_19030 [Streptomyces sp. KR55]
MRTVRTPSTPRIATADIRRRCPTWRGEHPFWAALLTFEAGPPIVYWP